MTTRVLDFSDTQSSATVPTIQGASSLALFADNASFEAVNGAGTKGSIYFNTTLNNIVFHDGASWKQNEAELNSFGNLGAPTVNDDESLGFSVGSIWEYNSRFWICKDSTPTSAIWIEFAQDYDGDITTLQNQIDSNDTDILALQTEQTTQNNRLDGHDTDILNLQNEQTTQNTNISNNASAISTIQGEQTTQNTNISNNASAISTIQSEQTTQNNRLTALETVQPTQVIALQDIDWLLGNVFSKQISTNEAFTFSNDVDGKTVIVAIFNNSGADVDVDFPVSVLWPSGTPVTTVTANTRTVWTFIKVGSTIIANAVDGIA
jgi:hypothetical protein